MNVELSITLGLGAWIVLIVASVVFGAIAQFIGDTRTGFEGAVDAVAFGVGALIGSEFIVAMQTYGPVWDGLALVPALVGGLIVGLVVELSMRYVTGGTYAHHPTAA
jgi:uncharacterized membrane protein YeaQ/YmgE (transglycosylase-associated protein family)